MNAPMTRNDVLKLRREWVDECYNLSCRTTDTRLPWQLRYEAAVYHDIAIEVIEQCDSYLKEFC